MVAKASAPRLDRLAEPFQRPRARFGTRVSTSPQLFPERATPAGLSYEFERLHIHSGDADRSGSPAWTENGKVYLRPATLLMPPEPRAAIIRHERFHQLQQALLPRDESAVAGQRAEAAARLAERGRPMTSWLTAAPSRLFYPPQAYSPWDRVWIGHPGLVMEVVEAGITVRTYRDYDALGVSPANYQIYECGKHDLVGMADLATKMRSAAKVVSKLNANVPSAAAAQRISVIAVGEGLTSAFRTYNGQGVIELKAADFEKNPEDTVTHEAGHALFEYHSVTGSPKAASRVPDAYALRIADVFATLAETPEVDIPTKLFDPKDPPPLPAAVAPRAKSPGDLGHRPGHPGHTAGIVMVMDTLWSGSGGHPWDGVDEFFASAYGGYMRNRSVLRQSIQHYQKADPKIGPAAKTLFDLLEAIGDPKKMKGIAPPAKPDPAAAELAAVEPPFVLEPTNLTWPEGKRNYMLEPSEMPGPNTIFCPKPGKTTGPTPTPTKEPSLEDLLK